MNYVNVTKAKNGYTVSCDMGGANSLVCKTMDEVKKAVETMLNKKEPKKMKRMMEDEEVED